MKRHTEGKLPGIGMRIIKSSVAVFLCFLFYFFFRREGILFFSQLAALWCIQPQWENTLNKALQRTVGTLTGAVFGLVVLLMDQKLIPGTRGGEFAYGILVAAMIIGVIYVTLLLRKKDASYFSCLFPVWMTLFCQRNRGFGNFRNSGFMSMIPMITRVMPI